MAKTIKIQKFKTLANKPAQPKKGISYAVEKAENMDVTTGKKMNGDIFNPECDGIDGVVETYKNAIKITDKR